MSKDHKTVVCCKVSFILFFFFSTILDVLVYPIEDKMSAYSM